MRKWRGRLTSVPSPFQQGNWHFLKRGNDMANRQASPAAVTVGGTQAERIVLNREELEEIIVRASGKVKTVADLKRFVDVLWAVLVAKRDGAIAFDREVPVGRRFS